MHHGKSHMGPPPPRVEQTDRQTCLKTLPSRKLRMRVVNIGLMLPLPVMNDTKVQFITKQTADACSFLQMTVPLLIT